MGVVYRARDGKLGREVALKVLPEALANDAEYMARFHREAKVLASLNHPNIATIHGLEANAIVMELVEGSTLAERMAKGAIPVQEALGHRRADRGSARIRPREGSDSSRPEASEREDHAGWCRQGPRLRAGEDGATRRVPHAEDATLVVANHANGRDRGDARLHGSGAGQRRDVGPAGGCLVLRCPCSTRCSPGIAFSTAGPPVMRLRPFSVKDPDWSRLPKDTPGWVKRLLRRCLERDKKKRLHDLGDAWAYQDTTPEEPGAAPKGARLPWIAAAAFGLIAALALWAPWHRSQAPAVGSPLRFDIDAGALPSSIAISPDGMRVVFRAGVGPLRSRLLDQDSITPLAGTEGAWEPFFSPDGRSLGFFAGGKLRKISLARRHARDIVRHPECARRQLGRRWLHRGRSRRDRRTVESAFEWR